jgi:hypothetical protein
MANSTSRRYESGRLVGEKPALATKPVWGKEDDASLAAMPVPDSAPLTAPDLSESEVDAVMAALQDARTDSPPPVIAAEAAPVQALPETRKEIAPAAPPPVPDAVEQITDTSDMRRFLLNQMVRAAKGEIDTKRVKNVVTLAQQVYQATSLELKAAAILKAGDKSIRALTLVGPQGEK